MNLLHRQKVNWADAASNHGRMKSISRQTLANQDHIEFLTKIWKTILVRENTKSSLSCSRLWHIHFWCLNSGVFCFIALYGKNRYWTRNFRKIIFRKFWFVGESIDVPPLKISPDITELTSFSGKDFQNRQCARITRSKSIRYNPTIWYSCPQ